MSLWQTMTLWLCKKSGKDAELNPLLDLVDLLNTGFKIIENGLLCGDEYRKRKISESIPSFH